jgi:O-antigen/teichoic acid export membrane protein
VVASTERAGFLSLQKKTMRAATIVLLGNGSSQLIRFAGSLITTRLLAPELFGVMAIANTVVVMISLFSDMGLVLNVVRSERGDTPVFLKTIFSFKLLQGVCLFAAVLVSGLIVSFLNQHGYLPEGSTYASPELATALFVVAFAPLLNGFRSIQIELNVRKQLWGRQAVLDLVAQVCALTFIILTGMYNPTIFSLAFSNVLAAFIIMAGSYLIYSREMFGFAWEKESVKEIIDFGKWIFGSTLMTSLSNNIDKFIIGYYLSSGDMGVFPIALLIFNAIGTAFNKVTSPLFSTLSDVIRNRPEDIGRIYYKIRLYRDALVCAPVCFVITNGDYLIRVLYDVRYHQAGLFLQIMCIAYLIDCFLYNNQVITAMGNSKVQFQISMRALLGVILLMVVGNYFWGVVGIVLAVALKRTFGAWKLFAIFGEQGLINWLLEMRTVAVIVICMALGLIVRAVLERAIIM